MQHRRSLAVSLIVTLVLAVAVLIARDQLVTTGEADTPPAAVTATEIPLVNLVQTADGQTVVVPAGSLDPQVSGDDDREHDDDHEDDDHDDDHEDDDD